MNKKIFKKITYPVFFLLSSTLIFAFRYNTSLSDENAFLNLSVKNQNKLVVTFNYYNFYNEITKKIADAFNFDDVNNNWSSPYSIPTGDSAPELYKNNNELHESFFKYVSGLSNYLGQTKNDKNNGPAQFILYVYPGFVDTDAPYDKGEILAKIPLFLPLDFTNTINKNFNNKVDEDKWPKFTKTFTLSKNPGIFNIFVYYDQEDHSKLPQIQDDGDSFVSKNGFSNLVSDFSNSYLMDLDRNEPEINFTTSANNLPGFRILSSTTAMKQPGIYSFDNPYGDDSFSYVPIILGSISLLLAISLYFPVLKYVRKKI